MSVQVSRRGPKQRRPIWPLIQNAITSMDFPLIGIVVTFLLLGLFMVFSASFATQGTVYFTSQLKWVIIGLLVCAVTAFIPYEFWRKLAIPVMAVTILALIAVLIWGERGEWGGVRTFTGASFQPSELAKLGLAIYVAAWVVTRGRRVASFKDGFLPFAAILGLVAGLIVLEKSVSMTLIVASIGLSIYFVGGGALKQFMLLGLVATPVLLFAMSEFGYPFERMKAWYDVWFNPSNAPQNLLQITWLLREGSGIGVDPGMWQLKAQVFGLWSDFLFANIGADFKIFGMLAVIALFCAFGYRCVGISLNAPTRFGALLAVGLTTWILVQAAVHIAASLTIIPATGQPLPFMSYGGSSLVSCMAAVGLLLSISRSAREKKTPHAYFAIGWGNWRPRLPHPGGTRRTSGTVRPDAERSAPGRNTSSRRSNRRPVNDKRRQSSA
jgi:cell division protein FtsW